MLCLLQMVPIKEMTDVMRVVKETAHLKSRQWVRIKRTVFRDDLAQIDYVEPAQDIVSLKLIPRIDYTRKRGVMRQAGVSVNSPSRTLSSPAMIVNLNHLVLLQDSDFKKKLSRPPQKLFDPDAIK